MQTNLNCTLRWIRLPLFLVVHLSILAIAGWQRFEMKRSSLKEQPRIERGSATLLPQQSPVQDVVVSSTQTSDATASSTEIWEEIKKDTEKRITIHSQRDIWTIERHAYLQDDAVSNYVDFLKNGHRIQRVEAKDMSGMGLQLTQAHLPTSYPVIALMSEPGCGHPIVTRFYAIRHGKLIFMEQMGAENGGPIFRDFDGDGKMEWVFDDFNWYKYYSAGPKYYLIYKEMPNGKLKLWKRVINSKRKALPNIVWREAHAPAEIIRILKRQGAKE